MSHGLSAICSSVVLSLSSALWAGDSPVVIAPPKGDDVAALKLPELTAEQIADEGASAKAADELEKSFDGSTQPEAVKMLVAILRGSLMGAGDGWFGPAQTRLDWKRLAELQGVDAEKDSIAPEQFHGPKEFFARLDRNADGHIAADDLDWSPKNAWVQQSYLVGRIFRRISQRGDGKLTKDDLQQFFDKTTQNKDYLTVGEFRDALIGGPPGGAKPSDMPSRAVLVRGLYNGEVGSIHEGPHVGDAAPDFTLKTVDGDKTIELSQLVGKKPVVVVFGNFTCGPFRSFYPDVNAVRQKYKDDAEFLMVYVREAHPTDGWHMEANDKVGVSVKQPLNFDERVKVCDQFCERLKPSMPVVVDDVDDRTGHAYSAMPARLYVIDTDGKVAYKSGRGPFGFIVAEMEQALVLSLLESATDTSE